MSEIIINCHFDLVLYIYLIIFSFMVLLPIRDITPYKINLQSYVPHFLMGHAMGEGVGKY